MRRFELVLAIAAVFAVGWPVVFGVRPRRGIVAGALSLALLAQLQLEGFRWQMVPLYGVAVGLAVGDVFYLDRDFEWSRRIIRGLLGTMGLVFAAALPVILPVPEIPAVSGPETTGTITVDVLDLSRREMYGGGGGLREFTAQVWYPAIQDDTVDRLVWSEDWEVVAPAISRNMGFPSWFLNHTRYTLSHARPSLAVADGDFPVVIFSHGWQGVRTVALNQVEHLVSEGYIVIAPDHTYGAAATVLGDGEVVYEDPDALPDPDEVSASEYDRAATELVATFAADIVAILGELESGEDGAFAAVVGSMDLNRVGVYGHSAGGGAAIKACLEHEMCSAVLGMDPWVEPFTERDLQENVTKPALYMRSEEWVDTPNDALLQGIAARGESITYMVAIDGTTHNDFVMTPLLSPIASQLGLTGELQAGRVLPIVDNYILGFFDVFLLGTGTAALDAVSFPEVTVSVIEP